jgi:hypothetical protein
MNRGIVITFAMNKTVLSEKYKCLLSFAPTSAMQCKKKYAK